MFDPGKIRMLLADRDEELHKVAEARRFREASRARNAGGGPARNLGRGLRVLADRLDQAGRSVDTSRRRRDVSYEPCC